MLLLADTCLLWGHRLSEWCGHGPQLEEDIALTNTALDVIAQARALYRLYAERVGGGITEDSLAYFRDPDEFQNVALAEVANGDYAQTILRSLYLSAWFVSLWQQLAETENDAALARNAVEAAKASRVQFRHAADWTIRFGDGTDESRRRIGAALIELDPYLYPLLQTEIAQTNRFERAANWMLAINAVFREATLPPLEDTDESPLNRTPRMELLAEMQSVAREHPGASW